MRLITQFEEHIMREQTHYSALQRQQQQPCADDHAAFIHKSGERKGGKAAGPAVFARARMFASDKRPHCVHAALREHHHRLLHVLCCGIA